ncbi:helix-turn-helix domain-containing protein [Methylomonas sp. BW4-1]|uniref:helix-turn-helix domain-containing protein n=1 Tax=Methylomonas sp. BW4-1 TaxID=3376685 RepID=UPI00404278FC
MKPEFLSQNLRLARLFQGLSLQELADSVGKSKQYLSRLESGIEQPSENLARDLAEALEVLPEFFTALDVMPIADEQCHFRKQLTTKVALRQVARAKGEMIKRLVSVLDRQLDFPAYGFLHEEPTTPEDIEKVAEACRVEWGLGLGPISNMIRVAENAGAVLMSMDGLSNEIDAISFATRRPVITLNAEGKSACRTRFGIAHEIGHLTIHVGVQTGDRLTESQANRFASAFLMPRSYFIKECQRAFRGSRFSWSAMADIKLKWKVSKAAILYRGRQLGVFSEDQYRSGVIYLRRHSEAIKECEDDAIEAETPEIVADGLKVLEQQCGIPRSSIAREMFVTPKLLNRLLGTPELVCSENVVKLFG